ncbi:alpha/beta fold hydrolase [Aliikangiella coralliicola]|uniref:Alpha/beta fold hydrolase n=1 Tax=Aliikangiella coralliicola TaxID=2592383 RepID=A0A545UFK4_9GAMM|nr:alpha/beta fold hydrolase [Aliikangiella coralliicola]TQV88250.1 alpha/beta fold hydrolase [Aliikangiella coralliicola]
MLEIDYKLRACLFLFSITFIREKEMKLLVVLVGILFASNLQAENFTKCKDADDFSELNLSICATVKTSLSHKRESKEEIELFVRKFPAQKSRTGSIWLIAGGPGESGASFYTLIDTFRNAFPSLDIFIPDHRGTGASSVICPGEALDSVKAGTLVGQEWGECFSHMYSNLEYVQAFNITNAAKDLNFLINTFSGEGERYIYGVSYGTQLTLRAMQIGGNAVDGIILDSLVPMQDDTGFDLSMRSQVVNNVGQQFLSEYARINNFSDEQLKNLKENLSRITGKYKSIKKISDSLPEAKLSNTLGMMLDVPHIRNIIPKIINDISKNDSQSLEKAIQDLNTYYTNFNAGYFNYGSSIPLVQIISASENNLRVELSKEDIEKESEGFLFSSPLPLLIAGNRMPTYKKDAYFSKLPAKLPKTLIMHGTLDPKTHFDAAKSYASVLNKAGDISLVSVEYAPHFVALNAPDCFNQHAKEFIQGKAIKSQSCKDKKSIIK